jgi:hypothetical protein
MNIIIIDRGEKDDLVWKQDQMIDKTFSALHKSNNVSINIKEVDSQNIFKPFGLDIGIYPPFCGARILLSTAGEMAFP